MMSNSTLLTKDWLKKTISRMDEDFKYLGAEQDDVITVDALKLALASMTVPDERAAFETFMEKRFKDCIDRRLVKNGDGEYFAWDMQVAWIVWQHRAAMQAEPVSAAYKLRDALETIRNSGIEIDTAKILAERDALNTPDCWCRTCRPITLTDMRFVVCPECGNKRCPHANDHRNSCTGSNEPGQPGSAYPVAPEQEV